MQDNEALLTAEPTRRQPWNKGKLIGAKPPLRPSHVWSIRTKLQIEGRKRDLALFNLAIDSKLRGCASSRFVLRTWRRMATRWIARLCENWPAGQGLSSRIRRDKPSTSICIYLPGSLASSYSLADIALIEAHEGGFNLPADWESQSGAAIARASARRKRMRSMMRSKLPRRLRFDPSGQRAARAAHAVKQQRTQPVRGCNANLCRLFGGSFQSLEQVC